MTVHLARRAGRVVAVDFVEEAVRRAQRRCQDLPNVEACVFDLRESLPAGPFDAAICSDVLYYLSPRELSGALRRIAGVVRGDGALVVAEFSAGSSRPPSRLEDVLRLHGPEWHFVQTRFQALTPDGEGVRVAHFLRHGTRGAIRRTSHMPSDDPERSATIILPA